LSEYNILVVPASLVENHASGVEDCKELQAVLIDFGQAVDIGHPSAVDLLKRDLDHVLSFFSRKGVRTMSKDEALALLLEVN
jgi:RIO-like serine/threonine protein kinase